MYLVCLRLLTVNKPGTYQFTGYDFLENILQAVYLSKCKLRMIFHEQNSSLFFWMHPHNLLTNLIYYSGLIYYPWPEGKKGSGEWHPP